MTPNVPDKPTLDGLEDKWMERWRADGTYAFDRSKSRADVYSIDTPPPTVSGSLHMGSLFGYVQQDTIARFHRMRGRNVFYPMGWDDNGVPTERRVQNVYNVRCDTSLPYDPDLKLEFGRRGETLMISRRNFLDLVAGVLDEDEAAFQALQQRLALSI